MVDRIVNRDGGLLEEAILSGLGFLFSDAGGGDTVVLGPNLMAEVAVAANFYRFSIKAKH
ncbi:hypothetical protein OROHE_000895 [Orobanche hederae]